MRLDAMLGKTTVGIEKKIKEPTIDEAKRNVAFYESFSCYRRFQRPYSIPAMELINNGINNELISLQEKTEKVLTRKLMTSRDVGNKQD